MSAVNAGVDSLMEKLHQAVAVLSTLERVAAVYADEEPLPAFNTYCRMTSLPLAFQTRYRPFGRAA
jgi:hypothetical protein